MKINLRLDYADGTSKEVSCLASDLVKFESKFDLSIAALDKNLKFTHLCFLAWCAETRTKATDKDFDTWMESVGSVGASDIDPK